MATVKRTNINGIPHIPPVSNSFLKSGLPDTAFIPKVSAYIITNTRPALKPNLKNEPNPITERISLPAII